MVATHSGRDYGFLRTWPYRAGAVGLRNPLGQSDVLQGTYWRQGPLKKCHRLFVRKAVRYTYQHHGLHYRVEGEGKEKAV